MQSDELNLQFHGPGLAPYIIGYALLSEAKNTHCSELSLKKGGYNYLFPVFYLKMARFGFLRVETPSLAVECTFECQGGKRRWAKYQKSIWHDLISIYLSVTPLRSNRMCFLNSLDQKGIQNYLDSDQLGAIFVCPKKRFCCEFENILKDKAICKNIKTILTISNLKLEYVFVPSRVICK